MKKNYLDEAIKLATQAHYGQVDKAGAVYILHPLRLMMRMNSDEERITAVLHDAVEDTSVTLNVLEALGFSNNVINAIDSLTRRDGEDYSSFIDRVNLSPLARKVKIEDIRDNLDVTRLPSLTSKDTDRIRKYHEALKKLEVI